MKLIACSDFVKRQVKGSSFSYSTIYSFEQIETMTTLAFSHGNVTPGYRDGVVLVRINPTGFVSGIVPLKTATKIFGRFEKRRDTETSYLQTSAIGPQLLAEQVDVVLYRHDVLEETKERTEGLHAKWEIISINAAPKGGAPMTPFTMARNQLQLLGGTKGHYSSEEWAASVVFWSEHALSAPTLMYRISKKVKKWMKIFQTTNPN